MAGPLMATASGASWISQSDHPTRVLVNTRPTECLSTLSGTDSSVLSSPCAKPYAWLEAFPAPYAPVQAAD